MSNKNQIWRPKVLGLIETMSQYYMSWWIKDEDENYVAHYVLSLKKDNQMIGFIVRHSQIRDDGQKIYSLSTCHGMETRVNYRCNGNDYNDDEIVFVRDLNNLLNNGVTFHPCDMKEIKAFFCSVTEREKACVNN